MTPHTIHEHYSTHALYISYIFSKCLNMKGEHKICYKLVLFTCSVDRQLANYGECGSKIVSANVSTEPSCVLAASSSQNSMPGGSFMEANTDMKKALRGAAVVPNTSTVIDRKSIVGRSHGIIFFR